MEKIPHYIYYIIILSVLVAVASCSDDARMTAVLNRADSLIMVEQPDSALMLIETAGQMKDDCSHSQLMRYELLKATAINKSDVHVFTSDSTVKRLVSYYDSYGSRNERMIARYLLGSVYRDLGDAPRALECYRNAAEMADTTSADCDYYTLCRVHGQMFMLYNDLNYSEYELEQERLAMSAAMKGKDTVCYLEAYFRMVGAYYHMCKYDSVKSITLKVAKLYRQYGYDSYAANTYPVLISILIDKGKYDEAKHYMDLFERESAAFKSDGDIKSGREVYYDLKGRYFLGIDNKDSAFYYFNKLLKFKDDMMCVEAGSRGLMAYYQDKNNADSVVKYARLYCKINDSSVVVKNQADIVKYKGLYDYTMSYRRMMEREIVAERYRLLFVITLVILIMAAFFVYKYYVHIKKKNRLALLKKNKDYADIISKYGNVSKELTNIKDGIEKYRKDKTLEINQLKQKIQSYREDNASQSVSDMSMNIFDDEYVVAMHNKAAIGHRAVSDELEELRLLAENKFPIFKSFINDNKHNLTDREVYICILMRLYFIPSEIATLLDIKIQNLTNTRARINNRLFGVKGAKTLDANIRKLK